MPSPEGRPWHFQGSIPRVCWEPNTGFFRALMGPRRATLPTQDSPRWSGGALLQSPGSPCHAFPACGNALGRAGQGAGTSRPCAIPLSLVRQLVMDERACALGIVLWEWHCPFLKGRGCVVLPSELEVQKEYLCGEGL